jgi:glycosyltransferase involved in cell wall biosynthesis
MRDRGLSSDDYRVVAAAPREVPSYLSASDAGLAFIKKCFSKIASSPTKYAEYLGCGLPLIINQGIGDSDALIEDEQVGALISEFNAAEYSAAARLIENLAQDPETSRLHSRAVAEKLFDVKKIGAENYARLYSRLSADKNDSLAAH